jgi:hypothetical protein
MRTWLVSAAALIAACGGGGGGGEPAISPSASSIQAVQAFMQAARDSNMKRMAELYGTDRGPGTSRSPDLLERRLIVIQAYLRGDSSRVVSDVSMPRDANRRRLLVSLFRQGCAKQVAIVTIRAKSGWIVNSVDLASAGNPARPCEPG